PRDCDLPYGVVTDKLQDVLDDPEIEVVAQLIGGLEPARTIMLQLMESGKNIVTANKALLAVHGPELFDRARELGRSIAFEASVAGGVPIIANISQCLSANQITSLRGILNGTSNFILSQMEEGADYNDAVKQAQRLGYAEADPSMDVDGTDAAQKLAILAHLAFGARVHWDQIPKLGIDSLDTADLRWAKQLGYRIKLLATAKLHADVLDLHVSPTLVKVGTPLAEVLGANNAISVEGDMVGRVFYHGLGAGQLPTASAVVADLIDTAVGRTEITFRTLELWSQHEPRVTLSEHDQVKKRYYLRVNVKDHPGVLAQIAGCLGKEQISIASMIQKGMPDQTGRETDVSLVIMTHEAEEGAAVRAITAMNQLDSVLAPAVRLPVIDE
ncbi:MAG: homoserine dehydrogenase, partial [Planctomycetales bacterium]|nr:homoserine dehydrogenase [Planctomycetales bacterium]